MAAYGLQDAFLLIDNNDSTYNFLPNDTSVNGNTFTITPNTNGLSYLWTPGDDVTQSLTVTTSGWYKLRIEKNCSYYYDSIYVSLSTSNGINKNKSSITRIFPNPSNGLFFISPLKAQLTLLKFTMCMVKKLWNPTLIMGI